MSSSQDQTTEHAPSALHQVVSLWPPVPATQSESLDKVQDRQALVLQTLLVLESLSESGRASVAATAMEWALAPEMCQAAATAA